MANQPMMFPGMGSLNPLAMMNPFMMQQMQQMAGGVDPRQSANGGGGQSAGANNDNSSSSSEEDEEVRRIHKETKNNVHGWLLRCRLTVWALPWRIRI